MIRQAAAYATAAGIGSVVGTIAGTIFGIVLVTIINESNKPKVVNITNAGQENPLDEP